MQSVQEQTINNQDIEVVVVDDPSIEEVSISVTDTVQNTISNTIPDTIPDTIPNTIPIPICQSSTDRKPLCVFGFTGGYNNCLGFLHHSVKPIVGVVKYDFSTWTLFPTTIAQSRELSLKWSNSFEKRKDFVNKSVIIFFHLQMKTIRIEVKEKMPAHNIVQEDGQSSQVSQVSQVSQPVKKVHGAHSYSKYNTNKYQPVHTTGIQVPYSGNVFGGYLTPEQMNYFPYQGYTQPYSLPYAYAQPPHSYAQPPHPYAQPPHPYAQPTHPYAQPPHPQ